MNIQTFLKFITYVSLFINGWDAGNNFSHINNYVGVNDNHSLTFYYCMLGVHIFCMCFLLNMYYVCFVETTPSKE